MDYIPKTIKEEGRGGMEAGMGEGQSHKEEER